MLKSKNSLNNQSNKFNDLYNSISSSYLEIIEEKKNSFIEKKDTKEFKDLDEDIDDLINSRNRSRRVEIKKNDFLPKRNRNTGSNMEKMGGNSLSNSTNNSIRNNKNYMKKNTTILNSETLRNIQINDSVFDRISEIPEKFDKENNSDDNLNNSDSENNEVSNFNNKDKDNKNTNFNTNVNTNANNTIHIGDNVNNKTDNKENLGNNNEKNLNPISGDILINNLKRPFTIFLHDIKMKKDFDCITEKLNEFYYKMIIKVQIFCGGQEYTKHKTIEWKSKFFPANKHIGKLIEFDLGYESLPMFASIVFKIKLLLFNNKRVPVSIDNFFWTNFKLFDHNRRLKTGKKKKKKIFKLFQNLKTKYRNP